MTERKKAIGRGAVRLAEKHLVRAGESEGTLDWGKGTVNKGRGSSGKGGQSCWLRA